MATAIKELSQTSNQNFSKECQNVFDKRWKEFNFDYYFLAYFLHPKYRDTGLQINTFRIICEKALSIWKLLGGREKSANELIAQISNYSLKSKPYDFEFVTGIHTVKNCLNCSLLQNMLQMHTYYVSNISNEIKHAYKELSDEGFEDAVTKTTFPFDDEIFDENDNELENNQFENDDELENNQFENNEVFEIEVTVEIPLSTEYTDSVTVEIPLSTEYTDSGEQDFNIESIINKSLERRESEIRKKYSKIRKKTKSETNIQKSERKRILIEIRKKYSRIGQNPVSKLDQNSDRNQKEIFKNWKENKIRKKYSKFEIRKKYSRIVQNPISKPGQNSNRN
ncbi:hypothetical protein Glove_672g5 [Diversispora epigaea]|uniref:Uncharacterized protein n=1 Tax=Diversispora epigaea TaxID=1348612 RepID=A0A397G9F3_9GLOM|nr:hypothetical protein Glove_672g5 [Diversispora epigaea]